MNRIVRLGAALVATLFVLAGLSACGSSKSEQKEDDQQTVGEEISEAGEATGEAAQAVGEEAGEEATDIAQGASKKAEQAEKGVESTIGGGPVKSDTLQILDEVDRETKNYQDRVDKAGDKLRPETRLRFKQVQESAKLLRKQYNEMQEEANLGIVELDQDFEAQADEIEDSWDNVQNSLNDQLEEIEMDNQ